MQKCENSVFSFGLLSSGLLTLLPFFVHLSIKMIILNALIFFIRYFSHIHMLFSQKINLLLFVVSGLLVEMLIWMWFVAKRVKILFFPPMFILPLLKIHICVESLALHVSLSPLQLHLFVRNTHSNFTGL